MKKWNKILAVAIVLTTAVSPLASTFSTSSVFVKKAHAAESTFVDQSEADSWALDAILNVKKLGIMQGDPTGKFRPLDHLTRQEFATILVNALHLEVKETTSSSFKDVPADSWATKYIETLNQLGYMKGDGGGIFRPEAPISREEVATILVRALGVDVKGMGAKLSVADKDSISDWAKDAVQFLFQYDVMKGDGTNFAPSRNAQRQEIAVILTKALPFFGGQLSKVESVADREVVIGGETYSVSDSLKGLFRAENRDVLKGATIKFEATNKTVTKVTYLAITASGKAADAGKAEFSGDLVLDANSTQIDGTVKVAGDYISLQNLTVTGDLEIGQELQNDFYSKNVKVLGKSIVNGGASNTVVYEDATLGALEINKPNVHVMPKGKTTIGAVTVNNDASLAADAGITIPKLTLADGVQQFNLNATVTNLEVAGKNDVTISGTATYGQLTVSAGRTVVLDVKGEIGKVQITNPNAKVVIKSAVKIKDLVLPAGKQASEIITNYEAVKGQIGSVNGTPSTGGGGGGGGTAPVVNHPPKANTILETKLQLHGSVARYSPSDLATDEDGDKLQLVANSIQISDNKLATASIVDGVLEVTGKSVGHVTISVRVTDGTNQTEVTIPLNVVDENLLVEALYGTNFRAHFAGIEALVHVEMRDGKGTLLTNPDLSKLAITNGKTKLVNGVDYSVDQSEGTVELSLEYLNKLVMGVYTLTFSYGGLTTPLTLTVESTDPVLLTAIQAVNDAANLEDMRDAIESKNLQLQLKPYNYLTDDQRNLVAQAVLDHRGAGYTNLASIQDVVDIAVSEIQLSGDEESAVQAVNKAKTVKEMLGALQSPRLHLDNKDYSSLEDYEVDIVADYLLQNRGAGYANRDAIQTAFNMIIKLILDDWKAITADAAAIKIGYATGENSKGVTKDITLPTEGAVNHATITWKSSNPSIISADGKVNRPDDQDVIVTLNAHLTNRYEKYDVAARITVKAHKSLRATVLNGGTFTEKSAGTETVVHLDEYLDDVPVPNPDLSSLVVKKGNTTLVKDTDYTVDDVEKSVSLNISYLNQLPVGTNTLTFSKGNTSTNVAVTVVPVSPEVAAAIKGLNAATTIADTRSRIEAPELHLQLKPYGYLTSAQKNQVAQLVLAGKGVGYVTQAAIQDAVDQAVKGIQLGGDETSAVQAVNLATTVEEMIGAMQSPILHLDNEDYSSLEDYEVDIVAEYLLANKGAGYANRDEIQEAFNDIIEMILDDWYDIYDDANMLTLGFAPGDSKNSVTQNLTLPTLGALHSAKITWSSDTPAVVSNTGQVNRPTGTDKIVTLTATLTNRYEHFVVKAQVKVKAIAPPLVSDTTVSNVQNSSVLDVGINGIVFANKAATVAELKAGLVVAGGKGRVEIYTDNTLTTLASDTDVITAQMVIVAIAEDANTQETYSISLDRPTFESMIHRFGVKKTKE